MVKTVKKIISPLVPVTGLKSLVSLTGKRTVFPLYHLVSDTPLPHIQHLQSIRNKKTFEKDLDIFLKYFKPVTLKEYLEYEKNCDRMVVLTFDDGLKECSEIIAPILKTKGIPAVFFLNNEYLDNRGISYRYKTSLLIDRCHTERELTGKATRLLDTKVSNLRRVLLQISYDRRDVLDQVADEIGFSFGDYLKTNPVYMTTAQVRDLIEDGFEIGSHGSIHADFRLLEPEDISKNILGSILDLHERFRIKEKYFAFPFTSDGIPLNLIDELLEKGKLDAIMGTSGIKEYPNRRFIQRIPMEVGMKSAKQVLKEEYLYYLMKSPVGKNRYGK